MMAVRRGHATGLEADGAQLVLRRQQVRNRPQKELQVGVLLVQMRLGGCLPRWRGLTKPCVLGPEGGLRCSALGWRGWVEVSTTLDAAPTAAA
ncbi:hypothetical protein MTO96_043876 [Rhipicephalus appendiculatus]